MFVHEKLGNKLSKASSRQEAPPCWRKEGLHAIDLEFATHKSVLGAGKGGVGGEGSLATIVAR